MNSEQIKKQLEIIEKTKKNDNLSEAMKKQVETREKGLKKQLKEIEDIAQSMTSNVLIDEDSKVKKVRGDIAKFQKAIEMKSTTPEQRKMFKGFIKKAEQVLEDRIKELTEAPKIDIPKPETKAKVKVKRTTIKEKEEVEPQKEKAKAKVKIKAKSMPKKEQEEEPKKQEEKEESKSMPDEIKGADKKIILEDSDSMSIEQKIRSKEKERAKLWTLYQDMFDDKMLDRMIAVGEEIKELKSQKKRRI